MSTVYTDDIGAKIGSIFRNASLVQARQYSGCEALELEEMDDNYELGKVISRQMTLIVISGAEMTILFKIHFNSSECDQLRRLKFRDQSTDEELAVAKTVDFMKEFTNQICGRICRIFQRNELALGMCIPLSMRGWYELHADYTKRDDILKKFGHAWRVKGDFGSFTCTAYVEINKPADVANLQYVDDPVSNDDGELEFL